MNVFTYPLDYDHIANVIRLNRSEHKMTQDQLAAAIGCCSNYISHIEHDGRAGFDTLVRIAHVLDFSMEEYLFPVKPQDQLHNFWSMLFYELSSKKQHEIIRREILLLAESNPDLLCSHSLCVKMNTYNHSDALAADEKSPYGEPSSDLFQDSASSRDDDCSVYRSESNDAKRPAEVQMPDALSFMTDLYGDFLLQ